MAVRARKIPEEIDLEKETARERMAAIRERRTLEDDDYEKIVDKKRKRNKRKNQSGKEHLLENLKAKNGMRLLREHGRLIEFSHRDTISKRMKDDDLSEWQKFCDKSQQHSAKLLQNQPDIVKRLNEKNRVEKEKEIQRREKEEAANGEWHYNGEMDEWEWTGENEPEYYEEPLINEALTDAERQVCKEAEERWMNAAIEERKQQRREKKKEKDKERKEAMGKPVNPLPARKMCQYEKIQESIIKEREEAMANCNFYEDLLDANRKMGFFGETCQSDDKREQTK